MRFVKTFENFTKVKNITEKDIIDCIKRGGKIFATIIDKYPDNDPEEPLTPASIDEEGNITCLFDGKELNVKLKNVEKIN